MPRKHVNIEYKTCEYCGKLFIVPKWRRQMAQKFCSGTCSRKGGFRYKGKNHPNYNPERPIILRLRNTPEYKDWVKKVFEKDNYTCNLCGKRGGDLNAHHILPFADFPEHRFNTENGITLCVKCHRVTYKFHGNQYVDCEVKVPFEKWSEFRENLRQLGYGNPEPSLYRKVSEGAETKKEPYSKVTKRCLNCGKEVTKAPSLMKDFRACSHKCNAMIQSKHSKRDKYGKFLKSAPHESDDIVRTNGKPLEVSLNG